MKKMAKKKIQTLKGFRDFLPDKMSVRREVIKRISLVFEKYGFNELQTPALEYKEVLTGKYGEEAEKLMYLFKDRGDRDVGLRYDLTVPLARVAAGYPNLTYPFKRYQIQPVWRAEKPQKGRYREFYQCDFDIIGANSPLADAEIVAILSDTFSALGFTEFRIKINSRSVLSKSLKKAMIPYQLHNPAIITIDKLEKKGKASVEKELAQKGLTDSQINKLFVEIKKAKPGEMLQKVIEHAQSLGVGQNLEFEATLSRGLDYYTGPIYEVVVNTKKSLPGKQYGSLAGGGRYDKLLANLGGPDLPATGASIGLDRVIDTIEELDLWEDVRKNAASVLVTVFSEKYLSHSIEIANLLRKSGINTELYLDSNAKLQKQLKYADKKGLDWAVIIGPEETLKREVVLKNLKTKTQESITEQALLTKIG